jgi:hypothetical protein
MARARVNSEGLLQERRTVAGPCCINTLNVTDRNDFEGLLYEAFCKTAARKNPIRRTGLRDRRSRHNRDRRRDRQEASRNARSPGQGRLMTAMLSQQVIEMMDAALLAMPLVALLLLAGGSGARGSSLRSMEGRPGACLSMREHPKGSEAAKRHSALSGLPAWFACGCGCQGRLRRRGAACP